MAKKKKINKDINHPKWGGDNEVKEVEKRILINDKKGAKIYAIFLK